MEAKYYTPTIEEFHVGFECEIEHITPAGNTTEYKKHTVTEDDNIKELYESNDWYSTPRVKSLDREDIESLGWKQENIENLFSLNGFDLLINNKWITISEDKADEYCFRGKLKNKSELKRIMVQTGIIEN